MDKKCSYCGEVDCRVLKEVPGLENLFPGCNLTIKSPDSVWAGKHIAVGSVHLQTKTFRIVRPDNNEEDKYTVKSLPYFFYTCDLSERFDKMYSFEC